MTLFERLFYLEKFGGVVRFHTEPFNGDRQTIFHHSAGVALILISVLGEACSAPLLRAALQHDLPEGVTGDIPAPVKWNLKTGIEEIEERFLHYYDIQDPSLSTVEKQLLRAADTLDAAFTVLLQRMRGNLLVDQMWERYVAYVYRENIFACSTLMQAIWNDLKCAYHRDPLKSLAKLEFWS